jgi:holo-[acyl-carrier protein] synthase
MGILGTGIDVIEIHRIEGLIEKKGERFLNRLFTEKEIEYCNAKSDSAACFAARFAVKEAFYKACSCFNMKQIPFKLIEIINRPDGKPELNPVKSLQKRLEKRGISSIHLSITHTRISAGAFVIIEG